MVVSNCFLGFPDESAARACYVAHIPERFLGRLYPVDVALLQGLLGLEPAAVVKAAGGKPRPSFGVGPGNKVHVRWPTTLWSSPAFDPEPTPAGDPASSPPPAPPASGAAPESPGAVAMARRAKALASMRKAIDGATYDGAKPLPPDLAQHPALTAEPTETYSNPQEVGGWLYVIDGADTASADHGWIAFVDVTGNALLWTSRDEDGGVNGAPYAFRRDDLTQSDAQGRFKLRGMTAAISAAPASKAGPVAITLDADELEAHAKAARAVQAMLPAGPARSIGKLDEAEKGMDGGTLFFSPDDAWGDDPAALAGFLASLSTPWLAEHPDTPRARLELAKTGKVFTHPAVPGSIFAASYDVAGRDAADMMRGPDADVPVNAKPPGVAPPVAGPDAGRGLPPELTDGTAGAVAKAGIDLTFIAVGKAADGTPVEQRFALGPVLIPDQVDLQGDTVSAAEIEKSERRFMELYQNSGDQHEAAPDEIKGFRDGNPDLANGKIVIVESYIVRDDRGFAIINGRQVKSGTWLMGSLYHDDEIWDQVKSGAKTGYSIGGYARKTPVSAD